MDIKKILLIKTRAMGDTIILSASIAALKAHYPQLEIDVLVPAQWALLLENHPQIHRIWVVGKKEKGFKQLNHFARLILSLRLQRFDAVANFHASPSSAWIAKLIGCPKRAIHFHGHRDKNLFSTVAIPDKGKLKPIIERDLDTLRALGFKLPEGALPRLYPQTLSIQEILPTPPVLALSLGASRNTKCWPPSLFAELAKQWIQKTNGSAFAFGGPHEGTVVASFESNLDPSIRAKVRTSYSLSLPELEGVLQSAEVFVGNDSGPKHLAVALDTPTVTLFGPEDPTEWHPYPLDQHPYFFIPALACRPVHFPGTPPWCGVEVCNNNHRCMRQIQPEEVLKEALRIVKNKM